MSQCSQGPASRCSGTASGTATKSTPSGGDSEQCGCAPSLGSAPGASARQSPVFQAHAPWSATPWLTRDLATERVREVESGCASPAGRATLDAVPAAIATTATRPTFWTAPHRAPEGTAWKVDRIDGPRRDTILSAGNLAQCGSYAAVAVTAGMDGTGTLVRRDVFRASEPIFLWPPGEEPACLGCLPPGQYDVVAQRWTQNERRPKFYPFELWSRVEVIPLGSNCNNITLPPPVVINLPSTETGCKTAAGVVETTIPLMGNDGEGLPTEAVFIQYELRFPGTELDGKFRARRGPVVVFGHGAELASSFDNGGLASENRFFQFKGYTDLLACLSANGFITLSVNLAIPCQPAVGASSIMELELRRAHMMREALRDAHSRYPEFFRDSKVMFMGHSQGGLAAIYAAATNKVAVALPASANVQIVGAVALQPSAGSVQPSSGYDSPDLDLAGQFVLGIASEWDEDVARKSIYAIENRVSKPMARYRGIVTLPCATHWSGLLPRIQSSNKPDGGPCFPWETAGGGPYCIDATLGPAPSCVPTFEAQWDTTASLVVDFCRWAVAPDGSEANALRQRFIGRVTATPADEVDAELWFRGSGEVLVSSAPPSISGTLGAISPDLALQTLTSHALESEDLLVSYLRDFGWRVQLSGASEGFGEVKLPWPSAATGVKATTRFYLDCAATHVAGGEATFRFWVGFKANVMDASPTYFVRRVTLRRPLNAFPPNGRRSAVFQTLTFTGSECGIPNDMGDFDALNIESALFIWFGDVPFADDFTGTRDGDLYFGTPRASTY